MIYISGLESILEAIYLEEPLGDNIGRCDIFVNPKNITYLAGKIVIINDPLYSSDNIDTLLKNRNTVIPRFKLDSHPDITYHEYILRPCFGIMWSGDEVEDLSEVEENCVYLPGKNKLLFPKVRNYEISDVTKDYYFTAIGWGLQQVGDNVLTCTEFTDLDLLKTKKRVY